MAEGTGFEPAIGGKPYNGLANRRLQPLGHPSTEEWIRHGVCANSFTGRASFRQTKPRTLLAYGPKKAPSSENFKQPQPIIRCCRRTEGDDEFVQALDRNAARSCRDQAELHGYLGS